MVIIIIIYLFIIFLFLNPRYPEGDLKNRKWIYNLGYDHSVRETGCRLVSQSDATCLGPGLILTPRVCIFFRACPLIFTGANTICGYVFRKRSEIEA